MAVAACAVLAVAAPAAVAKLSGGARYAGKTEEGLPVKARLSQSARRVALLRIRYQVTCDNGAQGTTSTDVFDVRIRRRGKFSYRGTYIGREDGSTNHVRLRGTVTRKAARGTFSLTAEGETADGQTLHCSSADVDWRAKRRR